MRILLVACLPAFIMVFLRSYLVVIDRSRALFFFSLAGLGLRLVLDPILIILNGIHGAAVAILISETLVLVALCIYLLRSHFKVEGVQDLAGKLSAATTRVRRRR
jgi:Na+-driven multidrug efflux pump